MGKLLVERRVDRLWRMTGFKITSRKHILPDFINSRKSFPFSRSWEFWLHPYCHISNSKLWRSKPFWLILISRIWKRVPVPHSYRKCDWVGEPLISLKGIHFRKLIQISYARSLSHQVGRKSIWVFPDLICVEME